MKPKLITRKTVSVKRELAPENESLAFESETELRNPELKSLGILSAGALHWRPS
jgi:hypothetical protein